MDTKAFQQTFHKLFTSDTDYSNCVGSRFIGIPSTSLVKSCRQRIFMLVIHNRNFSELLRILSSTKINKQLPAQDLK